MPELPEVHTISSDLNSMLPEYTIVDITVPDRYRVIPSLETVKEKLLNTQIRSVGRIAKNILINTDSDHSFIIHLAMSGQVYLGSPKDEMPRWTRVVFLIEKEGVVKALYFSDMRRFGKVELIHKNDIPKLQKKYGPEPIDKTLTSDEFYDQISKNRKVIKKVLMDQRKIAGMGNIYATDALFVAGIHPETPTDQITRDKAEVLLSACRAVLEEGIRNRGSTLKDRMYVDVQGKPGNQQNHFKIYGKEVCDKCQNDVHVIKIEGRSTYYCPVCQK